MQSVINIPGIIREIPVMTHTHAQNPQKRTETNTLTLSKWEHVIRDADLKVPINQPVALKVIVILSKGVDQLFRNLGDGERGRWEM